MRGGGGASRGRQGWGTGDTGDTKQRVRAGAFCRPSFVARARGAARGGGCTPPPPREGRGAAQSGVLEGEEAGQGGPDRHYSYGRAGPAPPPALRGPCAPGARQSHPPAPRGRTVRGGDAAPQDTRPAGLAPSGRCRSWRREAQGCSTAPPAARRARTGKGYPGMRRESPGPLLPGVHPKTRTVPRLPREQWQSQGSPSGEPREGQRLRSPRPGRGPCTGDEDAGAAGTCRGDRWTFDNGRESWTP